MKKFFNVLNDQKDVLGTCETLEDAISFASSLHRISGRKLNIIEVTESAPILKVEDQVRIGQREPLTLESLLKTQDLNAELTAQKIAAGVFSFDSDPITKIIFEAFESNCEGGEQDFETMAQDLRYSIDALTKAKKIIEEFI
jgi:hypothetical protein